MLSKPEIKSLMLCLGKTSQYIRELRKLEPMAEFVQFPKIPPALSESLTVHAVREGRLLAGEGPFGEVRLGGKEADILATTLSGVTLRVETKASGSQRFATFGIKDYEADFLLWWLFDEVLQSGQGGGCSVLVCPRPKDHLPWKRDRVTVQQLKGAWTGPVLQEAFIEIPF